MDSPSVFPVQDMSNKLCNKCVTIKSADDDKKNSLNQSVQFNLPVVLR